MTRNSQSFFIFGTEEGDVQELPDVGNRSNFTKVSEWYGKEMILMIIQENPDDDSDGVKVNSLKLVKQVKTPDDNSENLDRTVVDLAKVTLV